MNDYKFINKANPYAYIAAILIVMFLLAISFIKEKINNETLSQGRRMSFIVFNVTCTQGKGQSSLWFRNSNNEVKHVNVSYEDCVKYHNGDTVSVLFNEKHDWYLMDTNQNE